MALPPLVSYQTPAEYKRHYERVYCRGHIETSDGIRVYFSPSKFGHAFYESRARDGRKDAFSGERAERIDWIAATLQNPDAALFKGWDKTRRQYEDARRVAVVYESFVVVVEMRIKRDGTLKADFVTCYQADRSIGQIRRGPRWSKADCLRHLGK